MKIPEPGEMRTPLKYQDPFLGTATSLGDAPVTWRDVCRTIARVVQLSGNELLKASQVHAEVTTEVTLWYDARVTPKGRFVTGDRYLYVASVIADPENRFLTCLCRERIGEAV